MSFDNIAHEAADVIRSLAHIVDATLPSAAPELKIAASVIQAALAGNDAAKAIVAQVRTGLPMTIDQVHAADVALDEATTDFLAALDAADKAR